jgi:hypothetical protein
MSRLVPLVLLLVLAGPQAVPPAAPVHAAPPLAELVSPPVAFSAPSIEVPAETPLGKFVRVKFVIPTPADGSNVEIRKAVVIESLDAGKVFEVYDCAELERLVTGEVGKYRVTLTTKLYETVSIPVRNPEFPNDPSKWTWIDRTFFLEGSEETQTAEFAIVGPTPPPTPPEPTPPTPTPTPQATKLWLVAISKVADRTASQGAILTVEAWPNPHKFVSLIDGTAAAQGYSKYRSVMPCVIVMEQETRKVLGVEVIPGEVPDGWPASIVSKYSPKPAAAPVCRPGDPCWSPQ